jgi:hypothetical protein
MSPLNAAICTTISYTLWVESYYLKSNYLTLKSKVKVPQGHYSTRHTALWSCTHIPNIIDLSGKTTRAISIDKNVMALTRKYYLKNNYLTLRSKIKVPQRSLQYTTHRLMVMHPHTKYNWPIWKDNKGNAKRDVSPRLKIWSGDLDLWPWKSIGFQIILRTKYGPSLIKIHWKILILECSQRCYAVKILPGDFDLWPMSLKINRVPDYLKD